MRENAPQRINVSVAADTCSRLHFNNANSRIGENNKRNQKERKKGARTRTKARIRTVRVTGKDRNTRRNEIYGAIKIEDGEKKRGGGSLLVLLLHDALQ